MSRTLRRAGLWAALALASPVLGPAHAKDKALVPADLKPRHDAQGYRWDLTPQGYVNNGTQYCFNQAMQLLVNGAPFVPAPDARMSEDGGLIVFEGEVAAVRVVRRVKIDEKACAVRFLDVLRNAGRRRVELSVRLTTRFARSASTLLSSAAQPLGAARELKADEHGLVGVQAAEVPSAFLCLGSATASLRPSVTVEHGRTIHVDFTLKLAAGRSIALASTLLQRRLEQVPARAAIEAALAPFASKDWIADEPLRAIVANYGAGGDDADIDLGAEVSALAEAASVDREKGATLVVDEEAQLLGTAQGGPIRATCAFGQAAVPLAEVAAIRGGQKRGRPAQLYLRNGEVLAGALAWDALSFSADLGLRTALKPGELDLLLLRADKGDWALDPGARALLHTHEGTKLLVRGVSGTFAATDPWGALAVPLEEVALLAYQAEPYPGLWLTLVDGTHLPVAPHGEPLLLETARFGKVSLHPSGLLSLAATRRAPTVFDAAEGAEPRAPHCLLVGGSRLVGDLAIEALEVEHKGGARTRVSVAQVVDVRRVEGDVPPRTFKVTLAKGDPLVGGLHPRILPIKTQQSVRQVPVAHLRRLRRPRPPEPRPEEPPAPPAREPGEGKGEGEGKGQDGSKPDPAKGE